MDTTDIYPAFWGFRNTIVTFDFWIDLWSALFQGMENEPFTVMLRTPAGKKGK
jgi:hypothetical protein